MLGFLTRDRRHAAAENGHDGKRAAKYEDLLDDGVEIMPIVKVIEIIGTSTESVEDAIATGVSAAARSLRHITGADVKHLTVAVKNGVVVQYRVDLRVAFAIEPDDDD